MLPAILRQASAYILNRNLPSYKRFLYQAIDFKERLIGVKGARGCGKTTLLLQYAHSTGLAPQRILYIANQRPK